MWRRWCEYLLLFWGLPALLFAFRDSLAYAVLPLVLLVAAGCSLLLWRDGVLQRQWRQARQLTLASVKPILPLLLVGSLALLALVSYFLPAQLLELPRYWTPGWLLLLLIYPLFSALPQELIFRTYFFHRYQQLFPSARSRWLFSSCSFSFAHLFYGNWIAVTLSFAGGLLFGYRFIKSGSTALVVVEHSLWGIIIFSIGLGSYFVGFDLP